MAIGPATGDVITITVMGATGTGKSNFVNLLSNSGFAVGMGLLSCTPVVQVSNEFNLAGRRVRLIDTPGFDNTLKTDREILKIVSSFLAEQYRQDTKLSGVIYMHRISDFKMSGISRRNFGMFRSLCCEKTLKSVVIVTNMWGEVNQALGEAREKELITDNQLFKPITDMLIDNHPITLSIQSEIVDEHNNLEQTKAGVELESEAVAEQRRKQEEAFLKQREAAEAALRASRERQAQDVERARQESEAVEARARAEQERLQAEQAEARRQEEERIRAAQRELEAQAAARRAGEERLLKLEEERLRQAREAEEARQRHEAGVQRLIRAQNDRDDDCRMF